MRNILLTIQYDGKGYHGWQRQPGLATVQGTIEEGLKKLIGTPVAIDGTGRTDAGVHALGQRATFTIPDEGIPTDRIAFALTNLLPGDIDITEATEVPEGFHARFDAVGKTYRYRIVSAAHHDLFTRSYCYQVPAGIDVSAMEKAAAFMEGTHDFAAFQAAGGEERETTVRTVHRVAVTAEDLSKDTFSVQSDAAAGKLITVDVTGDGFLYNMVRIMAGTLVDAGFGRIDPAKIPAIIESCDRALAGHTAPPQGLFLKEVYFDRIP